MRILRGILVLLALLVPATSAAQQIAPLIQVLIIDSDRVFLETQYGRRLAAEIAAEAEAIRAENDRIVASLTEEERSLTSRRPEMTPDAFRAEAAAFDTKVQEIRRVRDAKEISLQQASAAGRAQFEQRVRAIVAAVMIERGAVVVLEQRTAVLSITAANITDVVIARVDAELGDGTE